MTYSIFKSFKSLKTLIKNKFKWSSTCCPRYKNNIYKILLNDIDMLDTQDTRISNPTFTFSYPHDICVNNELYIEYDTQYTNNTNNTQFDDTFY